jgi:hypothetical protein
LLVRTTDPNNSGLATLSVWDPDAQRNVWTHSLPSNTAYFDVSSDLKKIALLDAANQAVVIDVDSAAPNWKTMDLSQVIGDTCRFMSLYDEYKQLQTDGVCH